MRGALQDGRRQKLFHNETPYMANKYLVTLGVIDSSVKQNLVAFDCYLIELRRSASN
jgi:hypothetical protein